MEEQSLISYGELAALLSASIWAITSLILKTLTEKYPAALITSIRCGVAALLFWCWLPFDAPLSNYATVPANEWFLLIGSVVLGIVIGDQLYLHALKEMGISRTMALVGTFPITTLIWEQLLLDLPASQTFVIGCLLAASGVIILSYQSHQDKENQTDKPIRLRRGVIFSLSAAMLWGLSTTLLKPAIVHLSTVQANSIRLPLVTLCLMIVWRLNKGRGRLRDIEWKSLMLIITSGLLGMGIGSFFYLEAVVHIGPAKTATLSAATPVLSLMMGVIFLKEQFTIRLLLGVALCVIGVLLVL
ncbi:MAG: DMT family transporter [Candidatus Latescibacteria bacterium]|jgi:drug/metabolite transporter (DMT)-like permease|nr:DMT family transporter [Candidatus Latescibacterota bacterium]MBT5833030.1 DMT family transporter [Candidatus Latescibacterota bacterium]